MQLMTVAEAATYLGVGPPHIRKLIRLKLLKCANLGLGKKPVYRIAREWVEEFMRSRGQGEP